MNIMPVSLARRPQVGRQAPSLSLSTYIYIYVCMCVCCGGQFDPSTSPRPSHMNQFHNRQSFRQNSLAERGRDPLQILLQSLRIASALDREGANVDGEGAGGHGIMIGDYFFGPGRYSHACTYIYLFAYLFRCVRVWLEIFFQKKKKKKKKKKRNMVWILEQGFKIY